ncbi:transcriptional regulator [Pseudomonas syringae]|uniref:Transcriptional regulator n=1 Tax=Pseudomonas syringae TaxID=317 RepID=A0A1C7Z3I8_PSESX|nr:ATP-binding SpoIIE family protein phosphatase [Pseudomonas syringae]OCR23537.1 transcriptional regulator [Pseudomonas syringae]
MMLRSSLTQVLLIEDSSQVGHARRTVQQFAETLGFCEADAGRAALVTTELASNLLKHATRGELHLRTFRSPALHGIEVIAIDRGPGFDVHDCLQDGFSTRGTQGIGLGAISRQADVFDVHSDARGSVVLARFFPRGQSIKDVRFGVSQHSLHNDPACGDIWSFAIRDGWISALIIDGLGHGEDAELAARAGENAFARQPFASPAFTLEEMHDAMRGTRGGAVAVAQFDARSSSMRFVGIGNIGGTLISAEKSRGLASHPGIVGLQFRKAQVFDFPQVGGQLLIMYSDGLQSRWDLREYPGLAFRHPAVIAAVLHRDYCRGRDDVTVLVIALEISNV